MSTKFNVIFTYLYVLIRIFEQRCLNMMDKMYEENAKQAIELMNIKASVLGIYSSPITFAYENLMYDVVAHICSQKYMNKKWYNNLPPKSFYKVNQCLEKNKIYYK